MDGHNVTTSYEDASGQEHALTDRAIDVFTDDEDSPADVYAQLTSVTSPAVLLISPDWHTAAGLDYCIMEQGDADKTLPGNDVFSQSVASQTLGIVGWRSLQNRNVYAVDDEYPFKSGVDVLEAVVGENYVRYHDLIEGYPYEREDKLDFYGDYGTVIISRNDLKNNALFLGWNDKADGTGEWYNLSDSFSELPHDLYGQYEEYPAGNYCIIYDRYGLENGQIADIIPFNADGTVTLPTQVSRGDVACWGYSYNLQDHYLIPGEKVEVVSGVTLYAQLSSDKLGIIDGEGGTTASGSEYAVIQWGYTSYGELRTYLMASSDHFYKDGSALTGYVGCTTGTVYSFNDWTHKAIQAESKGTAAQFTAQYTTVTGNYIEYIGNGGTTADGSAYYIDDGLTGETANASANMFTPPEGKSFIGWTTDIDANEGVWYDSGEAVNIAAGPVVLYAQWGDAVSGTHSISYYSYNYSGELFVDETQVSNVISNMYRYSYPGVYGEDYLFNGWNTEQDGSGTWYSPGQELTDSDPSILKLYPQIVVFDEIGYDYFYFIQRYEPGKPILTVYELSDETATVTMPGDVTTGWKKEDNTRLPQSGFVDEIADDGFIVEPNGVTEVTSGDVFNEVSWRSSAELHKNMGDDDSVRVFVINVSMANIAIPSATETFGEEDDYEFVGWNTEADGSGKNITSLFWSMFSGKQEYVLYAQWRKDTPPVSGPTTGPSVGTVIFDLNGGEGLDSVKFKYGEHVDLTEYEPERDGYIFDGWYTDEELTKQVTEVVVTGYTKLYAKWIKAVPFTDVTEMSWYYELVSRAYASGLMDGTSATTFEPNANMTRAMVWTILARIDGETVTGTTWSDDARVWAMAEGVSDGTDPNGLVTREQFATMLYRYAVEQGYDVSIGESTNILSYADFASISEYAIPAMQWACGSGIITGVTESTLVPKGTATRAQCAAMLMRFIEL